MSSRKNKMMFAFVVVSTLLSFTEPASGQQVVGETNLLERAQEWKNGPPLDFRIALSKGRLTKYCRNGLPIV